MPAYARRVLRIDLDRLLEHADRMLVVAPRHRIHVAAAAQVVIVRFGIRRRDELYRAALLRRELHLQRIDDAVRDVILDREHVLHFAAVGLGPEVRIGIGFDELRGDAHVIARAPHAAFEHDADAELARDGRDARVLALELERRRARRDLELRQLAQEIEDFFGDAVAEIFVLGVAAHVDERKDRDRASFAVWLDARPRELGDGGRRSRHRVGYERSGGSPIANRRRNRSGAAQSTGPEVEHPAHDDRDRETERDEHDDELDRPFRKPERRQHDRGDLDDDPADDRVDDRGTDHAAPAQLDPDPGPGRRFVFRIGHANPPSATAYRVTKLRGYGYADAPAQA